MNGGCGFTSETLRFHRIPRAWWEDRHHWPQRLFRTVVRSGHFVPASSLPTQRTPEGGLQELSQKFAAGRLLDLAKPKTTNRVPRPTKQRLEQLCVPERTACTASHGKSPEIPGEDEFTNKRHVRPKIHGSRVVRGAASPRSFLPRQPAIPRKPTDRDTRKKEASHAQAMGVIYLCLPMCQSLSRSFGQSDDRKVGCGLFRPHEAVSIKRGHKRPTYGDSVASSPCVEKSWLFAIRVAATMFREGGVPKSSADGRYYAVGALVASLRNIAERTAI